MRKRAGGRWPAEVVLMAVVTAIMAALILVPNVVVLGKALLKPDSGLTLTLQHYQNLMMQPDFVRAVTNTLMSAFAAGILATIFGVSLAWIVTRTDTPLRGVFYFLNLVPFFLSPFVGALAWAILAAPKAGLLNHWLQSLLGTTGPLFNIYTLGGLIWVLALFYTPYVYLFTTGPMRSMDPTLEEAARTHGAGQWATMRRVTLPLLLPSILSAFLIAFVTSAEVFDIPIALTAPVQIPTLSTQIYTVVQYPPDYHQAAAISSVLVLMTLVGVWLQRRVLGVRSFATVTGKGYRPRLMNLGPWRWVALAYQLAYTLMAVVLPLLGLFLVSVSKVWVGTFKPGLFTWENFSYVLFSYDLTQRSLRNSLLLAVVGATVGVLIAFVISYVVHRTRYRWRGWAELVTAIPVGIPGIVLALGFLIVWIRTPLYGTIWLILLAYITRFLPYAQRNVAAMLQALSPELEQSARVAGASWAVAARRILFPLMRPGLVAAWLMLFVIYVRELSTSVLLYRHGTETMSVAMLIIQQRNLGYATAFALIQTLILLVAAGGLSLAARRGEGMQL